MRILVTGGLGFIGSAVVRRLIGSTEHEVLNLDLMTYAATEGAVRDVADDPRYRFARVDIADGSAVDQVMDEFEPEAVIHLAAESHVDRSIDRPGDFVRTNVMGTFELLRSAAASAERNGRLDTFRFVHVSTDEVFGALRPDDPPFDESTSYDPRSPYSASKAGSDHLARAWHETFGLPTIVTNCSNNYGPFQFPEKLIPLMILKARVGEPLPVYGTGENIRDWLFVEDHARALVDVLERGTPGETYTIGGRSERTNLEIVNLVCDLLDDLLPLDGGGRRADRIEFVTDRPGHDFRYAIDPAHIAAQLGFEPSLDLETGLERTVRWYLDNPWWWEPLLDERYGGHRLGTGTAVS